MTSAALTFPWLGAVAVIAGVVYAVMMVIALRQTTDAALMAVYRQFPLINTICGFCLFLTIFLSKFR